MKKNRKYKKIKIIMVFTTVLLIAFVAVEDFPIIGGGCIGLEKSRFLCI